MHTLLLQIGPMLCTARNFAELKKLACTVKSLCACQCPKRVQVCDIHTGVHQFDQHCEVTAQCSDETRVAVFVAVFLDRVGGEQVGVVGGALGVSNNLAKTAYDLRRHKVVRPAERIEC